MQMIDKKKVMLGGIILCFGVIVILVYIWSGHEEQGNSFEEWETQMSLVNEMNEVKEEVIEEKEKIKVHIAGEVLNPGIVELTEGSRIIDAIELAGGLSAKADTNKINLAFLLEDGMKICVPNRDEKEEQVYITKESGENVIKQTDRESGSNNKKGETIMVNINTAGVEELKKIQGIGESTANKIIAYRKENGKFQSIEELKNVKGIGEAKFNKMKDNICI